MNKMGVGMMWMRSLPNCQHHPNLAYNATTRCPPHLLSKKTRPHQRSRLAPLNLPLSQEEGHLPMQALLSKYESGAWRAYGEAVSVSPKCI